MDEKRNINVKIVVISIVIVLVFATLGILLIIRPWENDTDTIENVDNSKNNLSLAQTDDPSTGKIINTDNGEEQDKTDSADSSQKGINDKNEEVENKEEVANEEDDTDSDIQRFDITVSLGNYMGLEADYVSETVDEKEIDERLQQLRLDYSELRGLEGRLLRKDDMAVLTILAYLDGENIDKLSMVCRQVFLGQGNLDEKIESCIIGKNIGDSFETEFVFPEDYKTVPEVAGKSVLLKVEIVDGFEEYIPELNDAFIQKVTGYSTLKEYKDKVREELQAAEDERAYNSAIRQIEEKLVDNCSYTGQVDEEIEYTYNNIKEENDRYSLENYMMNADKYYALTEDTTEDAYYDMLKKEAEFIVKYDHALSEIAVKENLSVLPEEFDEKFNEIFIEDYGFDSKESVYAKISEEKVNLVIQEAVLKEKADKLVKNSAVLHGME